MPKIISMNEHKCTKNCKSGMGAMGHKIPSHRLSKALEHLRLMIPDISTEDAMSLIGKVAGFLENDEPYKALQIAQGEIPYGKRESHDDPGPGLHEFDYEKALAEERLLKPKGTFLDITGAYRLFAVLLAG